MMLHSLVHLAGLRVHPGDSSYRSRAGRGAGGCGAPRLTPAQQLRIAAAVRGCGRSAELMPGSW